ncbi:MAG: rod shape-determining protein MreC [Planctomycetota bacterium]
MGVLSNRGTLIVALLVLGVLSLRPVPAVEGLADRLVSPLRYLAQVTWPIRLLAAGEASAGADVQAGLLEEVASRQALEALYQVAVTEVPELVEGRRQVPAVVVSRDARDRDRIRIKPWTLDRLAVGQPVVHREAYVGRVASLDPTTGLVEVDLVTGSDFFVGARVAGEDAGSESLQLVVGGLAAERRLDGEPRTWLVAHNPSTRPSAGQRVLVHELLPELDTLADLAAGYGLGTLEEGKSDGDWRVRPLLDFLHGLYHVVVLTPADASAAPIAVPPHPLSEDRWVRARPLTPGDPSPWRSGLELNVGRGLGVRTGAAVVSGARLVGRVGAVSELGCEVRLLDDPGLTLSAVGRPSAAANAEPRVLGRLTSLGRRGARPPEFHWRDVTLPLPEDDAPIPPPLPMRLFTGSGERGLPAGLLIGEAELPRVSSEGRGHRIRLAEAPPSIAPREALWVRIDRASNGSPAQ